MVGGWEQASRLPYGEALAFAEEHLSTETKAALRHAQVCYYGSLGFYSMGGKPPDPPELDEEDYDEDEDD